MTEAKSKLGGGYSWTTSPWISPSGAYIYAYSEEAIDILSSDDLSLIEQHELSFDYADSNATVSDFVTTRDGTRGYAVYSNGQVRGYTVDGSVISPLFTTAPEYSDEFDGFFEGESLTLSNDEQRLYVGLLSENVKSLDAESGEVLEHHKFMGPAIAAVPSGDSLIVSGGRFNDVERKELSQLDSDEPTDALASTDSLGVLDRITVSPDSRAAVGTDQGQEGVFFDSETLQRIGTLPNEISEVWDVAPLPNDERFLVLAASQNDKNLLYLLTPGNDEPDAVIPIDAHNRADFRLVTVGASAGEIYIGGDREIRRIDLSASRTTYPLFWSAISLIILLTITSLLAAATAHRWVPQLRERSHLRHQARQIKDAERTARDVQRYQAKEAEKRSLEEHQRAQREATEREVSEREHAARVAAIKQWQDAYAEANDGQAPPPGFLPPQTLMHPPAQQPNRADRTNLMAILAIIFGIGGGLLGIVFGHIALAQIKKSGEGGRGLAITGLVFGYFGLTAILVYLIFALTMFSRISSLY